jgi:sec-independent protein translocase protein TatA
MFGGVGMWEIILVFMVVLLLFGAKRLPEIGSSLGKGIREFKSSIREIEGELKLPEETPRQNPRSTTTRTPSDEEGNGDAGGEPRRLTTSQ